MEKCPACSSTHIYLDRDFWVCSECAHEWSGNESTEVIADTIFLDANGQTLENGDTVLLIKDLKVKGASGVLKKGTKVRNIRLVEPIDGNNLSCKIEGFGGLNLKSEFVKKS